MHFSICLFLVLWFAAHTIWAFQYQQTSAISIEDILWFIGYGFFGYFLYSLYYHFFRREFEPFILILRLLSSQAINIYVLLVTFAYPILDAYILFFPAVLIFLAARRSRRKNVAVQKQKPPYVTKYIETLF
jgi:hypothetical protein